MLIILTCNHEMAPLIYWVGQIKRGQCSFLRRSKERFREFWIW